ncbi:MAG TPA: glycoside hydrolase family 76 protein [Thermoleophilaceae bacterium]
MTRRRLLIATLILAFALAACGSATPALIPARAASQTDYLKAAEKGVADSKTWWWDSKAHWYRQQMGNKLLATNWGIVHLFGAVDAVAIASPTPANKTAVRAFAKGAERYWNPDLKPTPGYGPYPGNHGAGHRTWYDDEGWWGMAFYDAFRATGDRRYLRSADRALAFLDSGWDRKAGGIYWDSRKTFKASESLAGANLLAAYLYDATGAPKYLTLVKKYTSWADRTLLLNDGLYSSRPGNKVEMPYVEGPMAVTFVVTCKKTGDQSWCAKGEALANRMAQRFPKLTMGPQFDALYVRALLELYRLDGNRRWYDVAAAATNEAMANARGAHGLYLRMWDGRAIQSIGTPPDKIQTHAATTSAIAWMAAAKPPG